MKKLFPAEYVLPGHPDKLCDAIADALVEEAVRREPRALCGVEVAVHRNSVYVTGRIACEHAESIDVGTIARSVFAAAGYDEEWGPDPAALEVHADVCLGPLSEGESEYRAVSDDQSIVTGYAVDLPGTNYLPPEHWLAARLARGLEAVRLELPDLGLGPDGKVIVVTEEEGPSLRLLAMSASLQQAIGADTVGLHRAVLGLARDVLTEAAEAIPGFDPAIPNRVCVNGAGNFAVGGPEGDNGLSGKKLVMDAYGPRVPIGGGALSGKDFFKADRAGAIIARRLTKAVVMTGAARECTATLAFFPGDLQARTLALRGEDGRELEAGRWERLIDRSLEHAGQRFGQDRSLRDVAKYGHFRPEAIWESVNFDSRWGSRPAGVLAGSLRPLRRYRSGSFPKELQAYSEATGSIGATR